MSDINNFVKACRDNNITLVRELLHKVDINGIGGGRTGLMWAMYHNRLPIVRMLLDHPNILVGTTDTYNNWTALHFACVNNREECVRLFLAHPQCNKHIVTVVRREGETAEMVATNMGYHGCARLIRAFLNTSQAQSSSFAVNPSPSSSPAMRPPPNHDNHGFARHVRDFVNTSQAPSSSAGASSTLNPAPSASPATPPPPPSTRPPPPAAQPGRLTLAQLGAAIDNIEVEEQTFLAETTTEINSLQQKLNEALDRQETGLAEMKNRKEALRIELHDRTLSENPEAEGARNVPPLSLIPECPACYEEMRPPKEIMTCGNGHLICSDCQPLIQGNKCITRCKSSYEGRATAMEQMVRQILGIM